MNVRIVILFLLAVLASSCNNEGITDITLNKAVVQMVLEDTFILEATVTPESQEEIVWTSDNESVATVFRGIVTAVGEGKAKITAAIGDKTAVCQIYVTRQGGTYYGEYELVWEENFDGSSLNTESWNVENGGGGWGNQEKQYYTGRPENLRVENGCLSIEVRKEKYEENDYTSARITTKDKHDFRYGKMEARICLPKGGGTWPAFWMLGYGYWPYCGEIDIMEHVGNKPAQILHALHTQKANGSKGNNWSKIQPLDNAEGEFHVYGVEWVQDYEFGRDAIRFYIDDNVSTVQYELNEEEDNAQWPFNKNFFIILNVALGGTLGGAIDDSIFSDPENNPVVMQVDWVRVYQKKI